MRKYRLVAKKGEGTFSEVNGEVFVTVEEILEILIYS